MGITEPIEFLFAFTAPWLFLAHALLTGLSLAICSGLDIQVGSYFSAGLLDLVLSYHAGLHSFWLIPWASSSSSSMPCSSPGCWNTPPQSAGQAHRRGSLPARDRGPTDPQMLAIQYLKMLGAWTTCRP